MKKKVFTALVLAVIFTRGIFAQQLERLTYEELKTDGTIGRTVTVEAYFLAWQQHEIFMEGNFLVTYSYMRLYNGDWGDRHFAQREPAMVPTLREQYTTLQQVYNLHPKMGMKLYLDNGLEVIRMLAIPTGHSSPFWWAETGRSFFTFFKLYAIKL